MVRSAVLAVAAVAVPTAQAFMSGAPQTPAMARSRPGGMCSLQMARGPSSESNSVKSKALALFSALAVGGSAAVPQKAEAGVFVSNAETASRLCDPLVRSALDLKETTETPAKTMSQPAPSSGAREQVAFAVDTDLYDPVVRNALSGPSAARTAFAVPADVESLKTTIKDMASNKNAVATATTVVSLGGLVLVLNGGAKKDEKKGEKKGAAPAAKAATPAPAAKAEDSLDFLLRSKKEELARAAPTNFLRGTATKVGTRALDKYTGTQTQVLNKMPSEQDMMAEAGAWRSDTGTSYKMGYRPPGYETQTVTRDGQ